MYVKGASISFARFTLRYREGLFFCHYFLPLYHTEALLFFDVLGSNINRKLQSRKVGW